MLFFDPPKHQAGGYLWALLLLGCPCPEISPVSPPQSPVSLNACLPTQLNQHHSLKHQVLGFEGQKENENRITQFILPRAIIIPILLMTRLREVRQFALDYIFIQKGYW